MAWRIAGAGVAGAAALGLFAGAMLHPTLAVHADAPLDPVSAGAAESGPTDLTPPYVSPASLQAWRSVDQAPVAPDRIALEVRRDLARASAELRASEAALEQYHRAGVLVRNAAEAVDVVGGLLAAGGGPRPAHADEAPAGPLSAAPPLRDERDVSPARD